MFAQTTWQGSTGPEDSSNCFYNARVSVQDPRVIQPIVYVDNRASSVLDNPADYRAAVVRFGVPSAQIPLFYYESTVSTPPVVPGGESIVTLIYRPTAAEFSNELVLVSINLLNPLDPTIRAVQQYLQMLNNALLAAWTALKAAFPLQPSTAAPFVAFDPATQLFSLYGQSALTTPGAEIDIEVTYPIGRLFGSIGFVRAVSYPYSGPGTGRFSWATLNLNGLNTVTIGGQPWYKMVQDFSTYPKWSSIRSLQFQVFGIPTTAEYLASTPGVNIPGQGVEAGGDLVSFVLTDFEPIGGAPDNLNIQYFPQGPLRWYNLIGNVPLRAITIQVLWQDDRGITRPVTIGYEDTFTLKIEFRRKTLNLC